MSGLFRFIIVIAVACTVIGCAPPIGSIGGGGVSGGDLDSLEAIPKKTNYTFTQKFERELDLTVFASYRGLLRKIPINEVDISVTYLTEPMINVKDPIPPDPNKPYTFKNKGLIKVLVEYNNLSATYHIEVASPLDEGGGGGNNYGDPPIVIEWDY